MLTKFGKLDGTFLDENRFPKVIDNKFRILHALFISIKYITHIVYTNIRCTVSALSTLGTYPLVTNSLKGLETK